MVPLLVVLVFTVLALVVELVVLVVFVVVVGGMVVVLVLAVLGLGGGGGPDVSVVFFLGAIAFRNIYTKFLYPYQLMISYKGYLTKDERT